MGATTGSTPPTPPRPQGAVSKSGTAPCLSYSPSATAPPPRATSLSFSHNPIASRLQPLQLCVTTLRRYKQVKTIKVDTVIIMEAKSVACQILQLICTMRLDVRPNPTPGSSPSNSPRPSPSSSNSPSPSSIVAGTTFAAARPLRDRVAGRPLGGDGRQGETATQVIEAATPCGGHHPVS